MLVVSYSSKRQQGFQGVLVINKIYTCVVDHRYFYSISKIAQGGVRFEDFDVPDDFEASELVVEVGWIFINTAGVLLVTIV